MAPLQGSEIGPVVERNNGRWKDGQVSLGQVQKQTNALNEKSSTSKPGFLSPGAGDQWREILHFLLPGGGGQTQARLAEEGEIMGPEEHL